MLSSREISEQLSIREFSNLSATVDCVFGKKHSEFGVLLVKRQGKARTDVIIELADGKRTSIFWTNLRVMPQQVATIPCIMPAIFGTFNGL